MTFIKVVCHNNLYFAMMRVLDAFQIHLLVIKFNVPMKL